MSFAQRIKDRRLELKMNQSGLAQKIGVTQGAVAQMEIGLRSPSLDLLVRLARTLETSVDWLLSGQPSVLIDIGVLEAGDRLLIRRFFEFLKSERAPRRYSE